MLLCQLTDPLTKKSDGDCCFRTSNFAKIKVLFGRRVPLGTATPIVHYQLQSKRWEWGGGEVARTKRHNSEKRFVFLELRGSRNKRTGQILLMNYLHDSSQTTIIVMKEQSRIGGRKEWSCVSSLSQQMLTKQSDHLLHYRSIYCCLLRDRFSYSHQYWPSSLNQGQNTGRAADDKQ